MWAWPFPLTCAPREPSNAYPMGHRYHEVCPLCRAAEFSELFKCRDYLVTDETFSVCSCARCGFRFTQPYPTQDRIGRYYESEDYVPMTNSTKGVVNKLYHVARRVMLRRKLRTIIDETGLRTGRTLDLGCGTGEFLATMKAAGWDAVGVEPDDGARRQAERITGSTIHSVGDFLALTVARFDVVTLWHVLEHVHDPHGYLAKLHEVLRPDGFLYIACPNCDCLDADHFGAGWAAYDVPRHLWHFTPDTMGRILDQHGFRICRMRPMPFDPMYISLLSAKHGAAGSGMIGAALVGLRSSVHSLRHTNRATAVVYAAKKLAAT